MAAQSREDGSADGPAPEEHQQLSILNPQPARLPGPNLLHRLVKRSSAADAPAIDYLGPDGARTSLSYEQLYCLSDALAVEIARRVPEAQRQPPFVIPILIPQCLGLYVSQLAILKAGGAFCPLNLDAPPDRIGFILKDVAAKLVLTTQQLAPNVSGYDGVQVLLVDELPTLPQTLCVADTEAPLRDPRPEDLAYVMYTSGSTGTPKGVGISHDAATQSLMAHDRHIPTFSRFLQFAAPTFDVSVFEIFFPLFRGSTLVSCSRAEMLDNLPAILAKMDIDACELTPTVAGSLLRSRSAAPGLRLLLTIGEMLTESVIKEFGGDSDRPGILWAMYGPTEATIHCTLQPSFNSSSGVGNIGFPLDTVSAYVVGFSDDHAQKSSADTTPFRVLPIDEVGELAVGGHQLATGYMNRSEQTAAAFIDTQYGRLYRTGDKARMTPDGLLECLGRISDGQVKLRGQRIELGEVEHAAMRAQGCHGAVASVIAGILVVFCSMDTINWADAEEGILESCRSWLPRFMIPGDVVLMPQFPRLPSGKIDRKGLAKDYAASKISGPRVDEDFGDELGRLLQETTREVLGTPVGSTSPLAAAGLDSLLSIKLASALRSSGVELSAVDILNSRTLAELRQRISRPRSSQLAPVLNGHRAAGLNPEEVAAAVPSLRDCLDGIEEVIECTALQVSMLSETVSDPRAYCNWVEFSFPAECSSGQIRAHFRLLAQRNQMLRTGFALHEGRFVQVLWKQLTEDLIREVDVLDRDFQLDADESFLHPLSIQLKPSANGETLALLRIHHSQYDGWSMDLITTDLNCLLRGEDIPHRPPFRHIVEHQLLVSSSREASAARQFWAKALVGYQPSPTPQVITSHEDVSRVETVEAALQVEPGRLRALSRQVECSPQAIFQAALSWIWSALVGSDDVVIGTVTSGRTIPVPDVEAILGPCLETVPLRVTLSRSRYIRELLETLHTANRDLLEHSFLPLAEIKRCAGILPGQALYDVLFVYQESLYSAGRHGPVREVAHKDYLETKLLLEVEPGEASFKCRVTYHSDTWPASQISLLIRQFNAITEHILEGVDRDLSSLCGCFPSDLLSHYNVTPSSFRSRADIASWVRQTASRVPENTAVYFAKSISDDSVEAASLSYRELNQLGNRIARLLRATGANEGDVVAIIMEKSILLYAGILGILKAGCAYLPLLPSTPAARTNTVLEQAGVQLCVTDSDTAKAVQNLGGSRVVVDLQGTDLSSCDGSDFDIEGDASRIANVIYTSGSTGVPKGVCITQLNVCSNLDVLSRIYPTAGTSRLLQSCSQAFDVSVFEIFFAWTQGICLCSATNDVLFEDLERAVRLLRVTHLSVTPTVASLVNPVNVPLVEFLVTSGEPMTEKVASQWVKQLYQGYGPSETTNICTVKKMGPRDVIRHLGHAFENTSSVVLYPDSHETVALGGVGEFCFGGDQVAAGYLNMPSLTAEKFISHPRYGQLYRSGDLGRMLPDGSLMIIGRIDDQIKLRGQRIELNEISSALTELDAVSAAVTLLVEHKDTASEQLATFYVPSDLKVSPSSHSFKLIVSSDAVRALTHSLFSALRSRLPSYMVPAGLIPVSSIPVTPSGKVNKRVLAEMFQALTQDQLSAVGESTEQTQQDDELTGTERKLAGILSEVLKCDVTSVGRWTPLLSLGLDSISAIRVARLIREEFRCRLPVSAILRHPSLTDIAEAVALGSADSGASLKQSLDVFAPEFVSQVLEEFGSRHLHVDKILPCTPLQEAMLSSPAQGSAYINRMLFRLCAPAEDVRKAWLAMCERHEILRTCFVTTDNPQFPVAQVVLKDYVASWESLDGSGLSIDACVDEHVRNFPGAIDSFQPPVAFTLIHEPQGSVFLSFLCHHALYDGEAMGRLLLEVEQLMQGSKLPPAPAFETFLQHALLLPDTTDEFWRSHLANFGPVLLSRHSAGHTEGQYEIATKQLGTPLSVLEDWLKSLGVSMLTLCQTTWACVMGILTERTDVCFGNVFSGRSVPMDRVDELVAPCFNTLPLRIDLSRTKRNSDLMAHLQTLNPEVLRYQFTPLRRVQKLSAGRLFDTLLLLQPPSRPLDSRIWTLERDEGEMDFPIVCEVLPDSRNDSVDVKLHCDSAYVSGADALLLQDLFSYVLETIMNFPSSHLPSRDALTEELRTRIGEASLRYEVSQHDDAPSPQQDAKPWRTAESLIRSTLSRLSSVPGDKILHGTTIYQLGLDSISAVQIASMLRKRGMKVSATDVMENPSCEKLAAVLQRAGEQASPPMSSDDAISSFRAVVLPLVKAHFGTNGGSRKVLPCTPLQVSLIAEFIRSGGRNYFNFLSFQLDGNTDVEHLKRAWEAVAESNPILRTGFLAVDQAHNDIPFAMIQYPLEAAPLKVSIIKSGQHARFNIDKWRLDASRRAIHNLELPPWEVVLVEKPSETTMHLAVHHALYDAASLQGILSNVARELRGSPLTGVPPVERAVSDILAQASTASSATSNVWESLASRAVINKFPVMTPLRVEESALRTVSHTSSISLGDLDDSTTGNGFSIQVLLQAAWTRILSSYLGETTVMFGVVLSGRNSEATVDASFPCISTLPVISDNKSSNRELIEQMMAYNVTLHKSQHVPLSRVQKWLGHPESRLFDTLLVYQKFGSENGEPAPWTIVEDRATIDYPVSLEVEPRGGRLEYRITFDDSILPTEQAELLLSQFDAVLSHLALSPNGRDEGLPRTLPGLHSVTPAEHPELPSEATLLHHFVEFQARKQPLKTALRFVTGFDGSHVLCEEWTYEELDVNGNRVADILFPYTKPGQLVAICFDKCPEAYFAILGILKAGCSFVALDPGAPPSRKEFIVRDSGAAALVTDKARADALDFSVEVPVIGLNDALLEGTLETPLPLDLPAEVSPSETCYCLYTSGTTGTPKGCEITHENAVQAMLAFQKLFTGHWDKESRWLQFASFHFDVSVLEQYWTWSVGITLVAAPRDLILDDLAGTISRLGITHIDLTPSLARLLHPRDVPSLCRGVFITGGEQLKQEILDVWGPVGVIHNFYGPTEATIGVTSYPCVPRNGRASNIGWQFPNVGSYVFHPGTEIPVLRGGVGELCVSGKLVGKGYLNREELTRERFPTLESFGGRVYRTGDLVRQLHSGCFDFLGRADDQVKLRGQRLEIGEINHAIRLGVPEVTDVCTLVIRDEKHNKDFLVSFVAAGSAKRTAEGLRVMTGEGAPDLSRKVQLACRSKLPGYMVPTYVLQLPFIPLSANNKAEVKELKNLFHSLTQEELTGSRASEEKGGHETGLSGASGDKLLKALRSLGIIGEKDTVNPDNSIFDLGVDSISVLRLSRALKREGVDAPASLILSHPILGELSSALDAQGPTKQLTSVVESRLLVEACQHRNRGLVCAALGIAPEQIEYIAPCSALQQGMISRSRLEEHRSAYFNSFRFDLDVGVSHENLKGTWQSVVDAHSVLRTRFVSTRDGFVQVALKPAPLRWIELEVSTTGEDHFEATLADRQRSWISANEEDIRVPLELLLVSQQGKRTLVLHIFHGLYDALSMELLLGEVAAAYSGTRTPSVSSATPTFLDALIHGPLRSFGASRGFWETHLQDVTYEPLPVLSEHPSSQDISVKRTVSFERLDAARKSFNVTHSAIVQALWVTVLQSLYSRGVATGLIFSGRSLELEDVERVIGPLFNTLPFHIAKDPTATWESVVQACHAFNVSTLPFQQIPLRDVQKWCSAGRPLFDTLFSFQLQESLEEAGSGIWTRVESDTIADYPLALEAVLKENTSLELLLVARQGVADEPALARLLELFEAAAVALAENPRGAVSKTLGRSSEAPEAHEKQKARKTLEDEKAPRANEEQPFEWNSDACQMREEIALLAGVPPELVSEKTTLLELGLDSIDTIKLSSRLRGAGIRLTNSQLIKGQSIAAYLTMVKPGIAATEHEAADGSTGVLKNKEALRRYLADQGVDLTAVEDVLPPTPLQESMVADMVQSEFRRYFNHDIMELSPDVDLDRFKEAWRKVAGCSPILRTGFVRVDTPDIDVTYCQVVRSGVDIPMSEHELACMEDLHRLTEEARVRAAQSGGEANLFQLAFARVQGRWYLVLSIAHALYDGWSLQLLHRDVEAAYRGDAITPRSSYLTFLETILQPTGREADSFWGSYLSGGHATRLSPRSETSREPQDEEKKVVARIEAAASLVAAPDVQKFCRNHAVSLQVVGQACWAAVLSTLAKSLDVAFGVVLSGRDSEGAEDLMFPTMNTVPVRVVLHGTVAELLRYMQDNMAEMKRFQHYPLRKAQRAASVGAAGNLFNTLFIFQRGLQSENSGSDAVMRSVDGASDVEYPVCVELELVGDDLIWRTACDEAYLSSADAGRLLHELDAVLRYFVNSPDANVLSFEEGGASVCGLTVFQPSSAAEVALASPQQHLDGEVSPSKEDWSPAENTIRSVLAQLSGLPEHSIKKAQSIYNLGLDSINAIKAAALLRKRGISLGVRDMLGASSITEMARASKDLASSSTSNVADEGVDDDAAISKAMAGLNVAALLLKAGIDPAYVESVLPATAMQVHMISVWQNTVGKVFFPEFRYRLVGVSGPGAVFSAWERLVAEQPILRTAFVSTGSATALPLVQVTLRPEYSLDGEEAVRPLVHFDATEEDGGVAVTLRIHHALYDGISLPVITERLRQLCGGAEETSPERDCTVWKRFISGHTSEASRQKIKEFWMRYLGDSRPFCQPRLFESEEASISTSARISDYQPAALPDISRLRAAASHYGLSTQAVFFAAYAKALSALAGGDTDVVFGVYLANRGEDEALAALPYPTLSLVPLLVSSPGERDIMNIAVKIQSDLHEISRPGNVGVALWEIKAWTGVEVGSFVNFLSLPDRQGEAAALSTATSPGSVVLEEINSAVGTQEPRVLADPETYPGLRDNRVRDAYLDAVDVEVAIRGEALDVGVFGPAARLGGSGGGVSRLLGSVFAELEGI